MRVIVTSPDFASALLPPYRMLGPLRYLKKLYRSYLAELKGTNYDLSVRVTHPKKFRVLRQEVEYILLEDLKVDLEILTSMNLM